MRSRIVILLITGSLSGGGLGAVSVAHAGVLAQSACTRATIGGRTKCIARGQFCARSHARDYRRYGLSCTKRDRNGRYHLQ